MRDVTKYPTREELNALADEAHEWSEVFAGEGTDQSQNGLLRMEELLRAYPLPAVEGERAELLECNAGHRFPVSAAHRDGPDENTGGVVLYLCPFCNPMVADAVGVPVTFRPTPSTQPLHRRKKTT